MGAAQGLGILGGKAFIPVDDWDGADRGQGGAKAQHRTGARAGVVEGGVFGEGQAEDDFVNGVLRGEVGDGLRIGGAADMLDDGERAGGETSFGNGETDTPFAVVNCQTAH